MKDLETKVCLQCEKSLKGLNKVYGFFDVKPPQGYPGAKKDRSNFVEPLFCTSKCMKAYGKERQKKTVKVEERNAVEVAGVRKPKVYLFIYTIDYEGFSIMNIYSSLSAAKKHIKKSYPGFKIDEDIKKVGNIVASVIQPKDSEYSSESRFHIESWDVI